MASRPFLLVTCCFVLFACSSAASEICHCMPDEPCWPTPSEWSAFNDDLGGRLLQPRPAASPCYDPNYDEGTCNEAKLKWIDAQWRSDQVGSSQHPLWDTIHGESCYINSDRNHTCAQGTVPVYAVNMSEPAHASKAFAFALKHNIRLVIKNTGHDYLGRSSGRGALSIWTHNLKFLKFHDNFVEDNCRQTGDGAVTSVTVGAGVQWAQLYKENHERGVIVAGGFSATVGASGGYTQGGGHSVLAPTYGLPADNVLQFEVVTPDGQYRIANRCQNKELFWALRGGGGGTFGVVLSTTHKTHPAPTSIANVILLVQSDGDESLTDFLEQYVKLQPSLSNGGWGGSFTGNPNNMFIDYMLPNGNLENAKVVWKELVDYMHNHPGLNATEIFSVYPNFLSFFNATLCADFPGTCTDTTGVNEILASRLIPTYLFEYSPRDVAQAMVKVLSRDSENGTRKYMLGMSVGGGLGQTGHPDSAALNPEWRKSQWHCILSSEWDDDASEEVKQFKFKDITDANQILRDLAPYSGSYFNEADYNEPNWQKSFFGEHYGRLLEIKKAIDPNHLLVCHHCVGSEDWNEDLTCRKI